MRFVLVVFFLILNQSILSAQDYNILAYGAVRDGKTMNTNAIQSAIDAANKNGGGRVIIPEGILQEASSSNQTLSNVPVNGGRRTFKKKFEFIPYQSLMLKISPDGKMKFVDITFVPKEPVVRPHEQQKMNF